MARPGFLIFRHVATVEGPKARLPIVWDESSNDYKFRHPYTPTPSAKMRKLLDDGFNPDFIRRRTAGFRTQHGSFDAVLAMAGTYVKGEGNDIELSFAPTSTEEERNMELGFGVS